MKPIKPRRVTFVLSVSGTTDRPTDEWAEGVARYLQTVLNEETGDLPADVIVSADDAYEE